MNDIKEILGAVLDDPNPPMASSAEILTLARRAERRRRGRWATGGAALAVAAVTVAAVAVGSPGPRSSPPPATPGAIASTVPAPAAGPFVVPLRYRPTWLPPGLGERERIVSPGDTDSVTRYWRNAQGARLDLSLRRAMGPDDPAAHGGKPVDINGSNGFYHGGEKSYVAWRAGDTVLSVLEVNLGLSQVDMLRVARSVRPDTAKLEAPFRLDHVPGGIVLHRVEFWGTSPAAWQVEVGGATPDRPGSTPKDKKGLGSANSILGVSLGTQTSAPDGGEPLTVDGRPARFVESDTGFSFVVVDLGQGLLLTLSGVGLSQAELIATAEGVRVDGVPDVSWIGAA